MHMVIQAVKACRAKQHKHIDITMCLKVADSISQETHAVRVLNKTMLCVWHLPIAYTVILLTALHPVQKRLQRRLLKTVLCELLVCFTSHKFFITMRLSNENQRVSSNTIIQERMEKVGNKKIHSMKTCTVMCKVASQADNIIYQCYIWPDKGLGC